MQRLVKSINFLLLMLAASQSSCYEGWEYYGNNRNGEEIGEETPEGPKSIYYILWQPIWLNAEAMADSACFANQGIKTYKENEWAARHAKAEAALRGLAEVVVTNPIAIPLSDCDSLSSVYLTAINSAPWGSGSKPEQDPLDRMTLHIKAPMWESEPSPDPPSVVTKEEWSAWEEIAAEGRRAKSLHYFVLSNEVNGYFSNWRNVVGEDKYLNATAINSVDPTPAGLGKRDEIIKQDTEAFAAWVASKAF